MGKITLTDEQKRCCAVEFRYRLFETRTCFCLGDPLIDDRWSPFGEEYRLGVVDQRSERTLVVRVLDEKAINADVDDLLGDWGDALLVAEDALKRKGYTPAKQDS